MNLTKTEAAGRCQDCTDLAMEIFTRIVTDSGAQGIGNEKAQQIADHAIGLAEIFTATAIRREAPFTEVLRSKTNKEEGTKE